MGAQYLNVDLEVRSRADLVPLREALGDSVGLMFCGETEPGNFLLSGMVRHMPDLQRIWTGATDQQLATLCQDYPGFYEYASLMDEGAEAEGASAATTTGD